MFKFFSTESDKVFAGELAERLRRLLPPESVQLAQKGATVNRISRLLEGAYESAAIYQAEHRLGMFRRAVLANHFKWELKSSGYSDDFVEVATEGLVVELSRAKAKSSGSKPNH